MSRPVPRPRVAVVGAGIAGLSAAWSLASDADVVVFESDHRAGGHAHTVDLTIDGLCHGVDIGFLVFNHATYPRLKALVETLGVPTAPSDMSFSVQIPASGLEWSGHSLDTVFAQRRNLLRPRFLGMLADLLRFNRLCSRIAERAAAGGRGVDGSIESFLDEHGFSTMFCEAYLLPMLGCIWSCPTGQMLQFPVMTMIRFCHNHGLIRITDRPQWYTVQGGSREYVQRMLARLPDVRLGQTVRGLQRPAGGDAGVWLLAGGQAERFDQAVLACHSDQALALLGDQATPEERALLGAIRYQTNRAVLHRDESLLPQQRKAWAAWNYERSQASEDERAGVCLHYLINRLQPLPWDEPVIVSLNPVREPAAQRVQGEYRFAHPVFDEAAVAAQARLPSIQGRHQVWFAGAWAGYGFHEDGLRSGLDAAEAVRAAWRETQPATWQTAA